MRQLVRWGVKSVAGLVANLALLTVWVDGLGVHPALALLANFVIISVASYAVVNWWVFPDGVTPVGWRAHVQQWAGTEAAIVGGKAANYVLYLALLPLVDYRVAWVGGAGATFLLTYVANKWWWQRDGAYVST